MAEFVVLGAGMVGIGTALALQTRGHNVTVLDRKAPGQETSFGNAGAIQAEAMEPYAMPRDIRTLWAYANGTSNDVRWHFRDLPSVIAPLARYFFHSSPLRHKVASAAFSQLIVRARTDHAPLIEAAGVGNIIHKNGLGEVYRSQAALDVAVPKQEAYAQRYDLAMRVLSKPQVAAEDPMFTGDMAGAVIWDDTWSCSNPGALVSAYAELFETRGGHIVIGDATTLKQRGAGWQVTGRGGAITAEHVVVALGPWSPHLTKQFGYRFPMLLKRGYHIHHHASTVLSRPYLDTDYGYVMVSMEAGLRLTTGAELCAQDAPQDLTQLKRAQKAASELVDLGNPIEDTPWHGHRPFMPDMVPVIQRAPQHKGLWFNFGHGHQGFTLGPTSGEILADIIGKA